ncbi:MAG: FAD-dependent oxidoreductase, partial [Pseudomonadota bacterium]|nr:FAD-dependent oxidoreductase [Pseudomonadota bacterium]
MNYDSDIAIVGGGLNGTAMALALVRSGLSVTLIDAASLPTRAAPDFDGRSYALALASQRMLAALGLWDGLAENAQPMNQIKVTDGRINDGHAFLGLHFDAAELEEGPMGYMVEDRHLRHALLDAVEAEPNITHMSAARVVAQEATTTAATLTLEDGKTITARVIIGADGRQSGTAERAGISRTGWSYDQTALVCAIAHEKPHQGIAHQFFMPSGPLAILPLKGNRSSIVWSEKSDLAQQINGLSDEKYLQILRPRF